MKEKNKKVQYLLVILVLVIWGAIAFQFFNFNGVDLRGSEEVYNYLPIGKPQSGEASKFAISLNYNDPFFDSSKIPASSDGKTRTAAVPKQIQQKINPQQNIKFPAVVYKGYSLNNDRITRVNLSINNKTVSMKIGEAVEGVLLKKTYRDSLLVSFMGNEKMVWRSK